MDKPKINVYTCIDGHTTVTVDRDEGVTPMFMECKHPGCQQRATSSFYQVEDGLTPTFEWYRPTEEDINNEVIIAELRAGDLTASARRMIANLKEQFEEHAKNGGLFIREIGK